MEKIFGYILLTIGLLLIIVPLVQTYAIFTGHGLPPQVFHIATPSGNPNTGSFDVQQQMQNAMIKILPLELINNTLNLASWVLLMMILIFGGRQLAEIGVKLVKNTTSS